MVSEPSLLYTIGVIQTAWSNLLSLAPTIFAVTTSILLSYVIIEGYKWFLPIRVLKRESVGVYPLCVNPRGTFKEHS